MTILLLLFAQVGCTDGGDARKDVVIQGGTSMVTLPSSAVVVADRVQVIAHGPDSQKLWAFTLPQGDIVAAPPVAANNSNAYVRGEKAVYSLDPDGKLIWSAELEDPNGTIKGIVPLGDSTVAVTKNDNELIAFSHAGQPRWTFTLPDGDRIIATPVSAPNSAVFLRGANTLYVVDPNGNLTWRAQLQ